MNLAKGCGPKKRKRLKSMYCHSVDLWTVEDIRVDLWTEDIHLYEVVWTCGPVDLWTCGPVDLWTCGPVDLWTEDIHLYEVMWTCGPVDLWTEDIHLYEVMWTCGLVD